MKQACCSCAAHFRPRSSLLSLRPVNGTLDAVIIDRTNQHGFNTPVNLYGKHRFPRNLAITHAYTQAKVNVSGYGSVGVMNVIYFCLTPFQETPCMPPFPTRSLDSTRIMLRLHSTFALVCDNYTGSGSTHTAPMSTKPPGYAPIQPLPTNSNRTR